MMNAPAGRRLRSGLVKGVILALVVLIAAIGYRYERSSRALEEEDAWVWCPRFVAEIILGPPDELSEEELHPINEPFLPGWPPWPVKTAHYRTRDGSRYLWYRERAGVWICYHSLWYHESLVY